jgi:lipopolysaccharide/colanic/teichoic acid biosynthesis glycosyltransferase
MKRTFDIVVSSLAIVALGIVRLWIALAVKIDSPGPVLFRQQRVGQGGRLFTILKFRSMYWDTDRPSNNVSPSNDPRITRVGRFIRAWYFDELPQLFNVLKGDMSFVGPRPETPEFIALLSPEERRVLSVRPGIAGPSTLAFMDEGERLSAASDPGSLYVAEILHDRVRLDLEYVGSASIAYDIRLLIRQALAIVRSRS